MARPQGIHINGKLLATLRNERGWSQSDLAGKVGVDTGSISKIERGASRPDKRTLGGIALAFGVPYNELFLLLAPITSPAGIDPASFDASPIPMWTVECSASHWVPVPICELNYDEPEARAIINRGLFSLKILGDCMQPRYPDGSTVMFRLIRFDQESMQVNGDYVLCRNDGTATFKKLVAKDDSTFTLAAINQAKYPGTFEVPRDEICRVAMVDYIVKAVSPEPLKIKKQK